MVWNVFPSVLNQHYFFSSQGCLPWWLYVNSLPQVISSHSHRIFFRSFFTVLNYLVYISVYWFAQENTNNLFPPQENVSTFSIQYLFIEWINECSQFCYICFEKTKLKQNSTEYIWRFNWLYWTIHDSGTSYPVIRRVLQGVVQNRRFL